MTVTETLVEELLVKSRHRVKTYGEVFTPSHMVQQMLDLVHEELESGPDFVDKTFLEPAAGDGNFLVAILRRKLQALTAHYPPESWPTESLFVLASIYGVELLEDNYAEAKDALLEEFETFHTDHGVPCGPSTDLMRAATFIADTNIICGNTLTGLDRGGEPIQFSWWNRIDGEPGMVLREPFSLESLRVAGAFDFTVYERYEACRIDQVHTEVRAGA
ncbi:MAG: methylase [Vicinamibacteria bacterium]